MTTEKNYRIHYDSTENDRKAELKRLLSLIRQLEKRAKELQVKEKIQISKKDDREFYERLMHFTESNMKMIDINGRSFKIQKAGGNDGASHFVLEPAD